MGIHKKLLIVLVLFATSTLFAKVLDPAAPFGSRKNPVPVRTTIGAVVNENGIDVANVELRVNGVMRGVLADMFILALQVATDANIPTITDKQKEYMIVVLSVESLEDLTGKDLSFYVGHDEVMIANENYVARTPKRIAHIQDELEGYLHEGSIHAGFLLYEVNVNEEYYLLYQNKWFDLGTKTDEETMNSIMGN